MQNCLQSDVFRGFFSANSGIFTDWLKIGVESENFYRK